MLSVLECYFVKLVSKGLLNIAVMVIKNAQLFSFPFFYFSYIYLYIELKDTNVNEIAFPLKIYSL